MDDLQDPIEQMDIESSYPNERARKCSVAWCRGCILLNKGKIVLLIGAIILFFFIFAGSFGAGYGIGAAVHGGEVEENNTNQPTQGGTIIIIVPDSVRNYSAPEYTLNTTFTYTPLKKKSQETAEFVYHYSDDYQINRNDPTQYELMETNEYQLQLDPSKFTNRAAGMHELLSIVDSFLGSDLASQPAETSLWYELQYDLDKCGADYSELRVRNYIDGEGNGTASSSVNKNVHGNKVEFTEYLLLPAMNHTKHSEQKLEQDIHPCYFKYNRKVKVEKLPFGTELTCAKCLEYFPTYFINPDGVNSTLGLHSNKTWWSSMIGKDYYLFNGTTKIKSSFNLYYSNYAEAVSGSAPPLRDSEWSLRIYSLGDGYGPWDRYVLTTIGQLYRYLLDHYHSYMDTTGCN